MRERKRDVWSSIGIEIVSMDSTEKRQKERVGVCVYMCADVGRCACVHSWLPLSRKKFSGYLILHASSRQMVSRDWRVCEEGEREGGWSSIGLEITTTE